MRTSVNPGQIGAGDQQDEAAASIRANTCGTQRLGLALLERYRVVGLRARWVFFFKALGTQAQARLTRRSPPARSRQDGGG